MYKFIQYFVKKLFFKYSYKTKKDRPPIILFNDWIGKNIILDGYYEKEIVQAIIDSLEFDTKNHICINVGANIGNHALQFEKYFNKVIGFEPQQKTFQILKLKKLFCVFHN